MIVVVDYCYLSVYVRYFFKQKTAYELRISDWSSDVCSSDLMMLGELRLDEFLAIGDLEPRIVATFVAYGREFPVRHSRTADRSGTVRRVDDRLVTQSANILQ